MLHIGIDISKTKFDACLLLDTKARPKTFDNSLEGFHAFMKWLETEGVETAHVCMEGTGRLWEPLAEFLHAQKCQVSVVNPARIKGFAQSEMRRSKTDKIDAKIIARFCRSQTPSLWVPPAAEVKALRDRQRHIDALKENRAQENNRLKSGVLDARVQRSLEQHIEYLDREIETLETEVLDLVDSHAKLRQDIIGVGQTTAVTFLGELHCAKNFSSSRELEVF